MKKFALLLGILAIALIAPPALQASEKQLSEELKLVRLEDIRPTQFNVGMKEVEIRLKKVREKQSEGEKKFDKYLRKHPAMVVLGPGKQLYLIDGHHLTRALHDIRIQQLYITMAEDWSSIPAADFWNKMHLRGWVYLKNLGKGPFPPSSLPQKVEQLTDDPYRSLAWMVREAGGYENLDVPFQEFLWADYFRDKQIPVDFTNEKNTEDSIDAAMRLIEREKPAHLPGYRENFTSAAEVLVRHNAY